jgi:hypothetical protein
MVKVYFETRGYAELAAVFMDESTYEQCLPALEKTCKEMGYDCVTESVEESLVTESIITSILRYEKI